MINLTKVRNLAEDATGSGPDKWAANQALISWFRSDPIAIISVLQAATAVRLYPGGTTNARLYDALDHLPEVEP